MNAIKRWIVTLFGDESQWSPWSKVLENPFRGRKEQVRYHKTSLRVQTRTVKDPGLLRASDINKAQEELHSAKDHWPCA